MNDKQKSIKIANCKCTNSLYIKILMALIALLILKSKH